MAKINLNKITPIKKGEIKTIICEDQEITVLTYLPINDKLSLVERVLNNTVDNTGFFNPMRLEIFTLLEVVRAYTNISITDKMMEDPAKLYDTLAINKIFDLVINAIPEEEFDSLFDAIEESAQHAVKYMTSFVGTLRAINEDYSATEMNVDNLMKTLGDPEQIGLVKNILEKLG